MKNFKKIVTAFINYPELITDCKFKGSVDCITGSRINPGTRIVTTSSATKHKYGIGTTNVTMTVDTYLGLNTGRTHTRNGQEIWKKDTRNKKNVKARLWIPKTHVYTDVDFSDVDKLI